MRPAPKELPDPHPHPRATRLPLALVLLLTLLTMGRIAGHEFAGWDNDATLAHNPRFNPPTLESLGWYWSHAELGLYVPVTQTVWWLLANVAQLETPDPSGSLLNPWVFHAGNVLCHLLSTALVFHLLLRLLDAPWPAAVGAAVFGVHPLQVESVAWASGMKDLLYSLLSLAALVAYVGFAQAPAGRGRAGRYAVATLALVLAMLAKPTAMVVPVLAAAVDLLMLRRPWRTVLASVAPWLALSVGCAILTKLVQPAEAVPGAPLWARPLVAADAVAFYLWRLIAPVHLAIDYGRRPSAVMGQWWFWVTWLAPVALAAGVWARRKTWPWLAAGFVLFIVPLLPILGFVPFDFQGYSTVADHYVYLPMAGVGLAVAGLISHHPRRAVAAGSAVGLLVLAGLSFRQAGVWADEVALWRQAVAVNPRSWIGLGEVGDDAAARGRVDEAIEHYTAAVEAHPSWTRNRAKLALLLIDQRRYADALAQLEAIEQENLARPPTRRFSLADTHAHMGRALLGLDRTADAIRRFEQALAADPTSRIAQAGLSEARQR